VYQRLLVDQRLHELLFRIDLDLAADAQRAGCECGGRLHSARFPRKPRGCTDLSPDAEYRLSFCCNREGCRQRYTPASVRFLGRKVYLGAVVLVASALDGTATPAARTKLLDVLGVSRRTLRRWRGWWRSAFVESPFWQAVQGRLRNPLSVDDLPRSLLRRFGGDECERVIAVLRWIAPITASFSKMSLAF